MNGIEVFQLGMTIALLNSYIDNKICQQSYQTMNSEINTNAINCNCINYLDTRIQSMESTMLCNSYQNDYYDLSIRNSIQSNLNNMQNMIIKNMIIKNMIINGKVGNFPSQPSIYLNSFCGYEQTNESKENDLSNLSTIEKIDLVIFPNDPIREYFDKKIKEINNKYSEIILNLEKVKRK